MGRSSSCRYRLSKTLPTARKLRKPNIVGWDCPGRHRHYRFRDREITDLHPFVGRLPGSIALPSIALEDSSAKSSAEWRGTLPGGISPVRVLASSVPRCVHRLPFYYERNSASGLRLGRTLDGGCAFFSRQQRSRARADPRTPSSSFAQRIGISRLDRTICTDSQRRRSSAGGSKPSLLLAHSRSADQLSALAGIRRYTHTH